MEVPRTPKEVLENALAIIEKDGWCQDDFSLATGEVCSMGAINKAIPFYDSIDAVYLNARAGFQLTDTIQKETGDISQSVIGYNDLPSTTEEDVKLMFKKAIDSCED